MFNSYDSRNNEWNEFSDFPDFEYRQTFDDPNPGLESPKIVVIPERKNLYMNSDSYAMRVLDMDTEKWTVVAKDDKIVVGVNPLVNVNGIVHCVGALYKADHCIYSDEKRKWQCIHDFRAIMGIGRNYIHNVFAGRIDPMYDSAMIFVESKQMILLIGVQDQGISQRVG